MAKFFKNVLGGMLFIPHMLFAFPCYLTIIKDSCWTNYDVTVTMSNLQNNAKVVSVFVPKGKSSMQQQFTCDASQTLSYFATFQPIIWDNQANTTYKAVRFWNLPKTIGANDVAWSLTACFPRDFSGVPIPPTATDNCSCDMAQKQ